MFEDYNYSSEILELPALSDQFIEEDDVSLLLSPDLTKHHLSNISLHFDSMDTYRFRWVTGHQIMFMFWHILNKELVQTSEVLDEEKLDHYIKIMDGCALVYEYTGSCTEDYYQRYIRPSMVLTHKAFSGYWAADYGRLPQLIRKVTQFSSSSEAIKKRQNRLKEAYANSQKSHISVAKRLVPEGESLLKSAKNDGIEVTRDQIKAHHYRLYDFFFLVQRTPVSTAYFNRSLTRRIEMVYHDLTVCPLPKLDFVGDNHLQSLLDAADSMTQLLQEDAVDYVH